MTEIVHAELTQKEFRLFCELIYAEAGISMSDAKYQLVASRLRKRLRHLGLDSYSDYYEYLHKQDRSGEERLKMINSLTTNKTDFFRENYHFDYLRSHVFPKLEQLAEASGERKIRIWSAACSTGEEPYSLAITVLEHFGSLPRSGWDIRILASDIDTDVISHATQGVYPEDKACEIPPDLLARYFIHTREGSESRYEATADLKQLITFRRINFMDSPWPVHTGFDVIFCRNVMIYFDEATQDRLVARFADQLLPNSHLFIGHSESIVRGSGVYKPLGKTIYRLNPGQGSRNVPRAQLRTPGTDGALISGSGKSGPSEVNDGESLTKLQMAGSCTDRDRSAIAGLNQKAASGGLLPGQVLPKDLHLRQQAGKTSVNKAAAREKSYSIIVGEIKASGDPCRISTVVGSCIAVCLFDPTARIGGMNHFMLPSNRSDDRVCASYGVHAMELLINEIMKLGGDRRKLVAKVFGGGNVLRSASTTLDIGGRNAGFALEFLETDCIPVISKDIGGRNGRQIQFLPHTGQAFIKPVENMGEIEAQFAKPGPPEKALATPVEAYGSIELF